jgi:Tfp pilus assembly protein PilP
MRSLTLRLIVCATLSGLATDAAAQAPAPSDAPPAAPAAGGAQPTAPTPPANYAYEVENRRDPFVSLFNRGRDGRTTQTRGGERPEGLGGIAVEEVVVRGIVQSRGGWVAMIASPTGRTYTIRPGDRLLDGSVRTITGQAVVLMQEVNDPLSLEKQREVRKFLRGEVK